MLISSSDPALSKVTYEQLRDIYGEQARALVEGGADLLLLETMQDLLELKAAIAGIVREFASRHAPRSDSSAADAHSPKGACCWAPTCARSVATLDALPVDVIGLNCSTGPAQMRDSIALHVRKLALFRERHSERRAAADGAARRDDLSREPERAGATNSPAFVRDFGVNVVGGCCGSTPEHVRAIARAVAELGSETPARSARTSRATDERAYDERPQWAASAIRPSSLDAGAAAADRRRANQQRRDRARSSGCCSRRRYDDIVLVAREQVEGGAHVLDVCCALTERADEDGSRCASVTRKLAQSIEAPLVDRFDRAGRARRRRFETIPVARSSTRSIWKRDAPKIDAVMPLALEHGAAVVALTIDESGMAKTAERKRRRRAPHLRDRRRRIRAAAGRADLRRADVHARDRRGGVSRVGGRDDRGHCARSSASCPAF